MSCPATFMTRNGTALRCQSSATGGAEHAPAPYFPHARHYAHSAEHAGTVAWDGLWGYEDPQLHTHVATLCTAACTPEKHIGGATAPGLDPPADRARQLLRDTIDVEDKAVVEGAAMLAAGHGVRFVFTVRNGVHVDVRAERVDYDAKGRIR
jgi:hypothetical protein